MFQQYSIELSQTLLPTHFPIFAVEVGEQDGGEWILIWHMAQLKRKIHFNLY